MIDVIIGLGTAGSSIVEEFSKLKVKSELLTIDSTEINKKLSTKHTHIVVPKFKTAEEYETKFPNIQKMFKKTKGKLLLVTAGGGSLSLGSLALLKQLHTKFDIEVLYIRPELEMLSIENRLKERIVYNVFQEYARSGMFECLYLVSNKTIDDCLGGIPLLFYNEKINETIAATFNTIMRMRDIKPVFETFHLPPAGARIATFGFIDDKNREDEKMFFSLDTITDSMYYFTYSEESLKTDSNLFASVKRMIRDKYPTEQNRISYGIYATNQNLEIVYCVKYTSIIQTDK